MLKKTQEETKSKTEINDIKSGWDKCIYVFFLLFIVRHNMIERINSSEFIWINIMQNLNKRK